MNKQKNTKKRHIDPGVGLKYDKPPVQPKAISSRSVPRLVLGKLPGLDFLKKIKLKTVFLFSGIFFVIVIVIASGLLSSGMGSRKSSERAAELEAQGGPRLLLLGLDGANWPIINQLIAQGKMPNLEKLMKSGVRAHITPPSPVISPAIWNTIATGLNADKHGVLNFISTSPTDYQQELVNSDFRKRKALWNILSDEGMKVGLFSYWATWPPEKINGYVVSDRAILDPNEGISPESLKNGIVLNTVKDLGIKGFEKGVDYTIPAPTDINDVDFFAKSAEQVELTDQLFRSNSLYAFDKEKPDVLMQIAGSTDLAQHLFLKFRQPQDFPLHTDQSLIDKYGGLVDKIYMNEDGLIGEYIKRAGPNTNIIVLSDHGFFVDKATGYRFKKFNVLLQHLGFLAYNKDGSIDYAHTSAFECNNNTFDWQRRLCINVKGRYPQGSVDDDQFQAVRNQVLKALQGVKTTTGESLFLSIDFSQGQEGDLIYDIKRELRDATLIVGGAKVPYKDLLELSIESGNHYADPVGPEAMLVWSGPNIKKDIEVKGMKHVDIMPTILQALGMEVPQDIDGKVITDVFEQQAQQKSISSYEPVQTTLTRGSNLLTEPEDATVIDGLRAYMYSSVASQGSLDEFCLALPKTNLEAVHVDLLEHGLLSGLPLKAWDNPEISEVVPVVSDALLEQLPQVHTTDITPDTFRFDDERPGEVATSHQVLSPVDINQKPTAALWTSTSFSVPVNTTGRMQILAKGDPAEGVYPVLRATLNGRALRDIQLRSNNYEVYNLDIPETGRVTISYVNDAKVKSEDRNAYIELIRMMDLGVQGSDLFDLPRALFMQNGEFCFTNTVAGSTELVVEFEHDRPTSGSTKNLTNKQIINLLEESGEFEDDED